MNACYKNFNNHHDSRKATPCTKTCHVTYRSLIGPPVLHSSPCHPKILCFTMLFNWPDTPKVPVSVGYTPRYACSLDPLNSAFQTASQSVQPFWCSSWQRVIILYNVHQNAINARFKKLVTATNAIFKKQVHQQACKMHTPAYGLKQRRCPQLRMAAEPRAQFRIMHDHEPPEPVIPELMPPPPRLSVSQCSPKGRRPVGIVGQHACKISRL